jgi:hypothetical protein
MQAISNIITDIALIIFPLPILWTRLLTLQLYVFPSRCPSLALSNSSLLEQKNPARIPVLNRPGRCRDYDNPHSVDYRC